MKEEFNKEATDLLHKNIFKSLERIETQTTSTNGRVTNLERAVLVVAAFSIGLGVVEARTVLAMFI